MASRIPGLRPPQVGQDRPDNTQSIVGREGIPVRQDLDGTQIQRLGVPGADADWGPDTITLEPSGDANNDDEYKIAEPDGVGGTTSSSGLVYSQDGEPLSVAYVWTDVSDKFGTLQAYRDDDASIVQEPGALQGDAEHTIQSITTKSDNCVVFVSNDAAAQNQFKFTLNFH
jgi:hypothetical protein